MADHVITDYGTVGAGQESDSAAIQRAIDACHATGGGRVVVPEGRTFVSGSFELKSGVELHVQRGATIRGATRLEDYPLLAMMAGSEARLRRAEAASAAQPGKRVMIFAKGAHDISITGQGTIDGNSPAFAIEEGDHSYTRTLPWRPATTCFVGCRDVSVRDVTFRNAANWTLHFSGCEDVVVARVKILNDLKFPNCDGIDPDHCRRVTVRDCHIEAGDDCIVLKNTLPFAEYGPCEDIHVSNCRLVSTSSAIKIGSESRDDFRRISFENIRIERSNRGVAIQLRDGGDVEDVAFRNIEIQTRLFAPSWWGAGEPVYVTAVPRNGDGGVGRVRNVTFENIRCRGEGGVFVYGSSPDRIDGVRFSNVSVHVVKSSSWPAGRYDLRPCDPATLPRGARCDGEPTPSGAPCHRDTPAVYVENATRVSMRGVETEFIGDIPDSYTHALEAHTAPLLDLGGFSGTAAHPGLTDRLID